MAAQALAQIRAVEGWSVGNVLGALVLAGVAVALIAFAVIVILRR